jgi:hypothetical protein
VADGSRERVADMQRIAVVMMTGALMLFVSPVASAAPASQGLLYHDGGTIRTVVVSSPVPGGGTDPLYVVTNGASGQLGIAGVAPGDGAYHGGSWQVFVVTFATGVTPYLLTSDEAVFAAAAAGDVTVTRNAAADFRCPVQP